jgi:phosphomannomutase
MDLVADCAAAGETVLDRLEALHRSHGLHLCDAHSQRLSGPDGPAEMARRIQALRTNPPAALAGRPVTRVLDLKAGTDTKGGIASAAALPSTNLLAFEAEGIRVLIRPSGTEPKLKMYFQIVEPVSPDEALDTALSRAQALMQIVKAAF